MSARYNFFFSMAFALHLIRQRLKLEVKQLKFILMKKLVFAVAFVMGLGTTVAFAENNAPVEVSVVSTVNDFTPIEVKDLPQAVQDALAEKYKDFTVKEAAVQVNEDETSTYQVTLTDADGNETVVMFNEQGEVIE